MELEKSNQFDLSLIFFFYFFSLFWIKNNLNVVYVSKQIEKILWWIPYLKIIHYKNFFEDKTGSKVDIKKNENKFKVTLNFPTEGDLKDFINRFK